MTILTEAEFDDFFQPRDPYQDPGFGTKPTCLYLYYMIPNDENPDDFVVRAYYHDNGGNAIQWNHLKTIVEKIAGDASYNSEVPPPIGHSLGAAKWRRKSYLVFVVDSDVWKFTRNKAVVFSHADLGNDNHTFFNGRDWKVDLPEGKENRSVFMCINHMQSKNGGNVGSGGEKFYISFNWSGFQFRRREDGNTNLGPPVVPPP